MLRRMRSTGSSLSLISCKSPVGAAINKRISICGGNLNFLCKVWGYKRMCRSRVEQTYCTNARNWNHTFNYIVRGCASFLARAKTLRGTFGFCPPFFMLVPVSWFSGLMTVLNEMIEATTVETPAHGPWQTPECFILQWICLLFLKMWWPAIFTLLIKLLLVLCLPLLDRLAHHILYDECFAKGINNILDRRRGNCRSFLEPFCFVNSWSDGHCYIVL